MSLQVRPMLPVDRSEVLYLLSMLTDGDRTAAQQALDTAFTEFWTADWGGAVAGVGALTVRPGRPIAEVEWLAVAPAFRRRGVASALLQSLQERCTQVGARSLLVRTFHFNKPSLCCYIQNGFLPHHMLRDYFGTGRHGVCLVWERPSVE